MGHSVSNQTKNEYFAVAIFNFAENITKYTLTCLMTVCTILAPDSKPFESYGPQKIMCPAPFWCSRIHNITEGEF